GLLKDPENCTYMRNWILEFLEFNWGKASLKVVWDALKAGVLWETLSFSLRKQRCAQELMKVAYTKLRAVENQLIFAIERGEDTNNILEQIVIAKAAINEVTARKVVEKYLANHSERYEYRE
ncbi:hypothetical protein NDU88_005043, partial [Pleurodeles waltl]